MRKYNAESPKHGSRRFNSIVKTNYIDDLGIVYLSYCLTRVPEKIGCDDNVDVFHTHFVQVLLCHWNKENLVSRVG